ncbi:MAG: lipopolysaccharide biosynthesis protein [Bacteroidaceae bacterium]|nr:lipopolysaccharide biosynthesis protein [Bacteroidaceae bacterium]
MAGQSLKDKTVKGVGWSAIDNVAQYAVSFLVSIVLARILSPDDYGLLGIIAIFTAICQAIANGGFGTALIRKKDANEDDYDTAFVVNLGLSVFLYIVLFFVAPLIAVFFEREELTLLTRVSSVGIIIGALSIVPLTQLTKKIDFKTQTKITIIASIISGVVGISMALLGFGVWSLVAQTLISTLLRTTLLWVSNHWLPKLRFSKNSFNDLFGFGWKMMAVSVIDTTWKELYQVVVGKFYSPASLGQYTRAKSTSQLFSSNLTNIIQRVTYPVLSDIQDDKDRMKSAYRRIIKTTMFITAICMFFLGAISEPFLYCLIGPKWHEAATYLPLICIAGSLYPLHAINLNMLEVQGRSDLFLGLEIVKKIIALAPLFVGAFVGIMPMLYTNLLTGIISFFLNSYYSGKYLGYTSWMQVKDVAPSYVTATFLAIPVWFLKYLPISNWIILPLQLFLGVSLFFLINRIVQLEEWNEVKNLLTPLMSRSRIIKK